MILTECSVKWSFMLQYAAGFPLYAGLIYASSLRPR
jgi:hypothetical protein